MSSPRKQTSRPALWILLACVLLLIGTMAMLIFQRLGSKDDWRQYEQTKAWARHATLQLRSTPGGEKLNVGVPLRVRGDHPSFHISVTGGVLNDETNVRLRAVFEAAGPPRSVSVVWAPMNCYGDINVYKVHEPMPLED